MKKRIPDVFDEAAGVLGEVKNVCYQSATRQILDYLAIAEKLGYDFVLYVNQSTKLSSTVQSLVEQGRIILQRFPQ